MGAQPDTITSTPEVWHGVEKILAQVSVAAHLATYLAHELIHWTKPQHPPGPRHGRIKWGDEGYAREELVAELGSAFLSADLGIVSDMRPDHAAYIASWVKVLKDDKRFIFAAAAHAQRAADYLHGLQRAEQDYAAA
jgi:antirestriction protein ArdC